MVKVRFLRFPIVPALTIDSGKACNPVDFLRFAAPASSTRLRPGVYVQNVFSHKRKSGPSCVRRRLALIPPAL
jgi:hypothetical protein